MAEFILKHVRHPAYASIVATGITVAGPAPDGFVNLTFFRELLEPTEEYFEREERDVALAGTDAVAQEIRMEVTRQGKIEHSRENVATIQVPLHVFKTFADAVTKMQAGLDSAASAARTAQDGN